MPLAHDAPCRSSLRETYDAMRVVGPAGWDGATIEDYADLDDAELPPNAAAHLADVTGKPVAEFEGEDYDRPDLDDLEEVSGE